ncbi:MAG: hypothetical protein LT071_03625 [Nocardioides sp.]|nr:hypothetical protein [Nocardioides sp.]
MDTCARCGADLGVGRFCLNCGHPVGAPVDPDDELLALEAHQQSADAGGVPDADDDLLAGRSWLAWIGAAVAVLVLLTVLASCLGGDPDPGPDPGRTESGPTSEEPEPDPEDSPTASADLGRKVRNLARSAVVTVPATAPATTDLDGEVVDYEADNLLDGDPRTAWRMPGDGTGREITLRVRPGFAIVEVGLVNGYAKQVGGVDWYPHNRRVEVVTWTFEDGSSSRQTLVDHRVPQTRRIVATASSEVRLTLESVSEPGPGSLGRDYTAISDVVVLGRRIR